MNDKQTDKEKEMPRNPLFTGDYHRDTSVSEWEKAAEASYIIRDAIVRMASEKKKR